MKFKGVPDDVLMAMVHAPHGGRGKPIAEPKPEPVAEVRPVENLGGMILGTTQYLAVATNEIAIRATSG